MRITKILFALAMIFLIISCESKTVAIEKQFKNEVQDLSRILNKVSKIQSKKQVVKLSDNTEAHYYNNEEKKLLLKKNKEMLMRINKNLRNFSLDYQNSNWADDAAFCRALAYIFVYGSNQDIFQIEDNLVLELSNNYNEIQLENWTKEKLENYYKMFAESIPPDLLSELSESEIIMNGLYHFLISEFSSNGEYQKAELTIDEIEDKGANKYIIKSLKDLVVQYKSMEHLLKSAKDNQSSLN